MWCEVRKGKMVNRVIRRYEWKEQGSGGFSIAGSKCKCTCRQLIFMDSLIFIIEDYLPISPCRWSHYQQRFP